MQFQIHLVGIGKVLLPGPAPPRVPEGVVALPPALCAWTVAGGKRDGFVEKEQLRVTSLGHHDSVTAPEFQDACNPAPAFIATHDFFAAVVQCAAAVAHHRAASRGSKDVAEGGYAVFEWHSKVDI